MTDDNHSTPGTSRRSFLKLSAAALGLLLVPGRSPYRSPFPGRKEPPFGEPSDLDFRALYRQKRIKIQGAASRVPALEFHGDSYTLGGDRYCMNPETFQYLMEWFHNNDVWAMTAEEVVGYVNGTMEMPARSVILTTDSGNTSQASLARMIPVLKQTGMHFNSFIWTRNMAPGEHDNCVDDLCWEAFREALGSGVFSFGTHTESHRDFAQLSAEEGIRDILQSTTEIEDALGVKTTLISWPYEIYPSWASQLRDHGLEAGFAGNCRYAMMYNAVLFNDPLRWSLPRLLPPNPGTLVSGRPSGMTIEEMMVMFSDGFE